MIYPTPTPIAEDNLARLTWPSSTEESIIGWRDNKALLCRRSTFVQNPKYLKIWINMASKAMKKKESKERVASAARTIPE